MNVLNLNKQLSLTEFNQISYLVFFLISIVDYGRGTKCKWKIENINIVQLVFVGSAGTPSKLGPTSSADWFATPSNRAPVTPNKAGSASSKKVFGSIERGLDKMKNMLTPR